MIYNTGTGNTATGFSSLYNNTGNYNTANGAQALKRANVQPVLLPGSVYALGKSKYPAAREMIEAFLRATPSSNAREIEHQHQAYIEYLDVDDPGIALDINTPEDYSSLQAGR